MKKIFFWGPYSGYVGTIKAQVNSAHAMVIYGGHDAVLIRAHSEFLGMENELEERGIRLLDLGLSRYFPKLEQSGRFARRPYMLVSAIFGFFPLVCALRRERPDIFIVNLIAVPATIACIIANIDAVQLVSVQGYPHFLGVREEVVPIWKRIENGVRKIFWNSIYPRADFVVTMTEETRKKLVDNSALEPQRVGVLKNPVVDERMLSSGSDVVDHAWYGKETPIIVGMGRLTHQKGFDILLQAFCMVKKAGVDARLLILGEGDDGLKLKALAESLLITDSVDFVGHKDNPFPYIANADIFVLSSRWEDPGHAIIEAAALGTPIVTTDCPHGPSELVSQGAGGWICRTGDPVDMASKIQQALTTPNPGMQKVAKQNANQYTLRSHYQAMMNLLKDLC